MKKNIKDIFGLTPLQEGILYHNDTNNSESSYCQQLLFTISGRFDKDIIQNSYQLLIDGHDILRTSFVQNISKQPLQVVLKHRECDFHYTDIRDNLNKEDFIEEYRIKDLKKGFKLDKDLLMRLAVFRLSENTYKFLWSFHHIILDGWSVNILINKFKIIYSKVSQGESVNILENISFKDYILWLRNISKDEALTYWRNYISSYEPIEIFPKNGIDIYNNQYVRKEFKIQLGYDNSQLLRDLVVKLDVTLNSIFCTLWGILLSKIADRRDIMFGNVVSTRPPDIDKVENIIGLFINTLPNRISYNHNTTISELIKQTYNESINSLKYSAISLAEILSFIHTKEGNVIDNIIGFQNFSSLSNIPESVNDNKLDNNFKIVDFNFYETSHYDLNFGIIPDENIEIRAIVNSNIYDPNFIETTLKRLKLIIQEVANNVSQRVDDISIIDADEKEKLLLECNTTKNNCLNDLNISGVFERTVESFPNLIALKENEKILNYENLNKKSNQLARLLIDRGVKKNDVIGIMVDSMIQMVVFILGVLKAGATYIPIKENTNQERLETIFNDSDLKLILTNVKNIDNYSYTFLSGQNNNDINIIKSSTRKQIEDLDNFIIPDRSLVNYEKYNNYIGLAAVKDSVCIQATRGCPFHCAYCHKIWPKSHIYRSAEHILNEVETLYNLGVKRFSFIDDIFNLNKVNSARFFKEVRKRKWDVQFFFPNGMRGDLLTEDYIDLMIEAGTVNLSLSLESSSPRIQKMINKRLNIEKLRTNIEYICKNHPQLILDVQTMHGFPSETEEEALMTLNFIKDLKWIHFPYIHVLKIYPNTEMEKIAIENGVSPKAILESANMGYHELSKTLPFESNFTLEYQTQFLNEYFLNKERLKALLPYQLKVLTKDEIIQKYNAYLDSNIRDFDDILKCADMSPEELGPFRFLEEDYMYAENLNLKFKKNSRKQTPSKEATRVLLLDLSSYFSSKKDVFSDMIEPPLGLLYIETYLNEKLGQNISCKILKSKIDFDSYIELRKKIEEFNPDIIGIRTLTYYKEFFHYSVNLIRQWGFKAPIIVGGPYATSDYNLLLKDKNIDLVILGEGEITFHEVVSKFINNDKKLPNIDELRNISGLVFSIHNKQCKREILSFEDIHADLISYSGENLNIQIESNNPAYIIYTSGSTGIPKGTIINHKNVLRTFVNSNYIDIRKNDKVLQLSNYSFDGSVFDIFGSLLNGAQLVSSAHGDDFEIEKVSEIIKENQITVVFMTTALFNVIVDSDIQMLENIRKVLFGGEIVSLEHVKKAFKTMGQGKLIHMYGPTETTVFASYHEINSISPRLKTIPIGVPISNTSIYVLNNSFQLCPYNVPGNIYIGGDGLSIGYLNNIELTHNKFIWNTFNKNELLYHSGDNGKRLPDNTIEFIGRKDDQVKIRGYRVELGEIESVLKKFEFVSEAAVITKRNSDRTLDLIACIVVNKFVDTVEFKKELKEHLPSYMIPTYMHIVDKMPLNSSNKIDKKALLNIKINLSKKNKTIINNKSASKLLDVWAEVLGVDQNIIDYNADFFELGGHSLKATTLKSKIQKDFNVNLSIKDIFTSSSFESLLNLILQKEKENYIKIKKVEKREYYPLSSAQKRMFILNQIDKVATGYNISFVFEIIGDLDINKFNAVLQEIVKRHESLRTSFAIVEEEPVQKIHNHVNVQMDYLNQNGKKLKTIINEYLQPFKITKAPLFRCCLIQQENNKKVFVFDLHHIIADGASIHIIIEEFRNLYANKDLKTIDIQYKDYAIWQNKSFKEKTYSDQKNYWTDIYKDDVPVLNLPTDFKRGKSKSYDGAMIEFSINKAESDKIRKICEDNDTTLFMTLISTYYILISKLSNQNDIVIGSAVSGRNKLDLEPIVGMFVNMLPIRCKIDNEINYQDFLRKIRELTLNSFENQDYQYEALIENLRLTRFPNRNPLFEVAFNLQNSSTHSEISSDINIINISHDIKSSVFDLVLDAFETDNGFKCCFSYCTKLFKESTIKRFIEFYLNILQNISNNPNILLKNIELISNEEKKNIINHLNSSKEKNEVTNKTLIDLFNDQVINNPDSICIEYKHKSLTYRDFDNKSECISLSLVEKGVNSGDIVAMLFERSIEMVIGIFGILKAGCAYLPIEPSYPQKRIEFILSDSKVNFVLSQQETLIKHNLESIRVKCDLDDILYTGVHEPISDLDILPIPNRSFINCEQYANQIGQAMVKNSITIQASRGCPFKCAYCHEIWPKSLKMRSAEHIYSEVESYYNIGIKRFVFVDDIFNLDKKNSTRFFNLVIDNGLDIQLFFPNGLRGDILTKEYIDLMVKAGTVNIALALETASSRLQKLIGKRLDLKAFEENISYICETYPHVILDLFTMHGFPTESEKEAQETLDFILRQKWIDFPYVHILKIYPGTPMEELALSNGISSKDIEQSVGLAYHDVPETLPFDTDFSRKYQTSFLEDYFMLKERLLAVLPNQLKTVTKSELVEKYNSYLPYNIKDFTDLLEILDIKEEELGDIEYIQESKYQVDSLNDKINGIFLEIDNDKSIVKQETSVLLIDLSRHYSGFENHLYEVLEQPLGLLCILTYLKSKLGNQIDGKIIKSGIDFNSDEELEQILKEYNPQLIGVRTLSYYKDFFHKRISVIKKWNKSIPVIAGGPYATSSYKSMLLDLNIDIAIIGEGEDVFYELIKKFIQFGNKFPELKELKSIKGLAFIPEELKHSKSPHFLLLDEELKSGPGIFPKKTKKYAASDVAYIIYTSGTTGIPKGVMIEHQNVVNLLQNTIGLFGFKSTDIWSMFHSYCFDFSVWEIFGSLSTGGKLVIIPELNTKDATTFLQKIRNHSVSVLNQTPSVFFNYYIRDKKCLENSNLRYIIFGGEKLHVEKLKEWYNIYPNIKLINMFGITETTVHVTFKEITDVDIESGLSNIGTPLRNYYCYVLDDSFNILPYGVSGELYVGGMGLARGYLNNEELTLERFIINPYNTNEILYRTGDIVKMESNGDLTYYDRKDNQIQLRGFRIELEEIKNQLLKYNSIKDVVVEIKSNTKGDSYICAYYVSVTSISNEKLHSFLSEILPYYMIPNFFVHMQEFPVTSNGKINRSKLGNPTLQKSGKYVAPQNEVQSFLVDACSTILSISRKDISIQDDFFTLGGNSLNIIQMLHKIQQKYHVKLSIAEFFKNPKIEHVANQIITLQLMSDRKNNTQSTTCKKTLI